MSADVRGETCPRCSKETRRHVNEPAIRYCASCDLSFATVSDSPKCAREGCGHSLHAHGGDNTSRCFHGAATDGPFVSCDCRAFVPSRVPESGTPQRSYWIELAPGLRTLVESEGLNGAVSPAHERKPVGIDTPLNETASKSTGEGNPRGVVGKSPTHHSPAEPPAPLPNLHGTPGHEHDTLGPDDSCLWCATDHATTWDAGRCEAHAGIHYKRPDCRAFTYINRAAEPPASGTNPFRSPHAEADYLAGAVCRLVDDHILDARSEAADRLLDYATSRFGSADPIGNIRTLYREMIEWRKTHQ